MEVLNISNISLNLEGIQILSGLNMIIQEGTIHSVIGPNGSGKTSLMNCITGYYRPNGGSIFFSGKEITHLKPNRIAALGISRMFQHIEVVREFSVVENVMLGKHIHLHYNPIQSLFFYGKALREELRQREEIEEILSFMGLQEVKYRLAGALPYGTQKRVELARAIAVNPTLLILDEPTSGMNQQEKEEISQVILKVRTTFIPTIILIEHDVKLVMRISDTISVMSFGNLIAEGPPSDIQNNNLVIEAYLGPQLDIVGDPGVAEEPVRR
jgi:branched-chain amino acid transport system ATP-binding protein